MENKADNVGAQGNNQIGVQNNYFLNVPIFIEGFLLLVFATLFIGVIIINSMGLDTIQKTTLGIAICSFTLFLAYTFSLHSQPKDNFNKENSTTPISSNISSPQTQSTVKTTPSEIQSSPKEPTFTEGFDVVTFTVGSSIQTLEVSDLEKAKHKFFIGDVPAFLYVDNGKPYVDVDLYGIPNEPPVRLRHNKLLNRPSSWDLNSDEKALEVVNEKGQPIFQIYYKTPSHIVVYGLFFNGYVPVLASERGIQTTPKLDGASYPIKPIFKYPSEKHFGQRSE